MLKRLKRLILPKEINFFQSLSQQSSLTSHIIDELATFYLEKSSQNPGKIFDLIAEAKKRRLANLKELNATFITPVDKEAISRVYVHLHWVALSIKHLVTEIDTYKIYELRKCKKMFDLLGQEMAQLTTGITLLDSRKYELVMDSVYQVIHLDNELIKEYADVLARLFQESDIQEILKHREILSQLKEISKRIHICANHLEDLVFKMN
jgi:uncharacterized protein Yka (UPF0111/DUF47 family)